MALRYAILGLLSAEPMSGYDLSKWMDRGLANVWSAHASQIYPELARMLAAGAIEEVPGEGGPRRRRVYGITEHGDEELRRWLERAEPDTGARSEALLRAVFLGRLDAPAASAAFAEQGRLHRERELHHASLLAQSEEAGSPLAPLRLAFDCGARLERALAEWAEHAAGELAGAPRRRSAPRRKAASRRP